MILPLLAAAAVGMVSVTAVGMESGAAAVGMASVAFAVGMELGVAAADMESSVAVDLGFVVGVHIIVQCQWLAS